MAFCLNPWIEEYVDNLNNLETTAGMCPLQLLSSIEHNCVNCSVCGEFYATCEVCTRGICIQCILPCTRWGFFRQYPVDTKALDLPPIRCDKCFKKYHGTSIPIAYRIKMEDNWRLQYQKKFISRRSSV